jgi:hypothetical protein
VTFVNFAVFEKLAPLSLWNSSEAMKAAEILFRKH